MAFSRKLFLAAMWSSKVLLLPPLHNRERSVLGRTLQYHAHSRTQKTSAVLALLSTMQGTFLRTEQCSCRISWCGTVGEGIRDALRKKTRKGVDSWLPSWWEWARACLLGVGKEMLLFLMPS